MNRSSVSAAGIRAGGVSSFNRSSVSAAGIRAGSVNRSSVSAAGIRAGGVSSFNRSSVGAAGIRAGSVSLAGTNRAALATGVRAPWASGGAIGAHGANFRAASFHAGQWNGWLGAGRYGYAAGRYGWGYHNHGWVNNGYWHNHYPFHWHNGYWGWWRPFGYWPGWRLWGYGGYGYGYGGYGYPAYSYVNPYYTESIYGPLYYDYSQPLPAMPTEETPPSQSNSQSAMTQFEDAQAQFKRGDATSALQNVDLAIRTAPSDTRLHEFRALALFSLGRYNEAAETLYPVLAAGPGWNWETVQVALSQRRSIHQGSARAGSLREIAPGRRTAAVPGSLSSSGGGSHGVSQT